MVQRHQGGIERKLIVRERRRLRCLRRRQGALATQQEPDFVRACAQICRSDKGNGDDCQRMRRQQQREGDQRHQCDDRGDLPAPQRDTRAVACSANLAAADRNVPVTSRSAAARLPRLSREGVGSGRVTAGSHPHVSKGGFVMADSRLLC